MNTGDYAPHFPQCYQGLLTLYRMSMDPAHSNDHHSHRAVKSYLQAILDAEEGHVFRRDFMLFFGRDIDNIIEVVNVEFMIKKGDLGGEPMIILILLEKIRALFG